MSSRLVSTKRDSLSHASREAAGNKSGAVDGELLGFLLAAGPVGLMRRPSWREKAG